MIETNTDVHLEKIDVVQESQIPTPTWEEHAEGKENVGQSLPVQYWLKGKTLHPIKESAPMVVERHVRNGEERLGIFRTSRVDSIRQESSGYVIKTHNSIYFLTIDDS